MKKETAYSQNYNGESHQKPVSIVLSKKAIQRLHDMAKDMGMKRNDLMRLALYNLAFKNELATKAALPRQNPIRIPLANPLPIHPDPQGEGSQRGP